jgi:hypothetical protein
VNWKTKGHRHQINNWRVSEQLSNSRQRPCEECNTSVTKRRTSSWWQWRPERGGTQELDQTNRPPKSVGSASWAVFKHQFEAAASRNNWTCGEVSCVIAALQVQAANILPSVLNSMPGSSWAMSRWNSLQQPSSSWPTVPLPRYLWT